MTRNPVFEDLTGCPVPEGTERIYITARSDDRSVGLVGTPRRDSGYFEGYYREGKTGLYGPCVLSGPRLNRVCDARQMIAAQLAGSRPAKGEIKTLRSSLAGIVRAEDKHGAVLFHVNF